MAILNFQTLYLRPRLDPDTSIVVNKSNNSCQLFTYTFCILHVSIGAVTLEQRPVGEWYDLTLLILNG